MRRGLESIRGEAITVSPTNLQRLGLIKYGVATLVALLWVAGCIAIGRPRWGAAAVLLFYAVEAQFVFLFPLALDGVARPLRASRRWTIAAGGTFRVMATVLPIAAVMLLGGFVGRGFVRSWCIGCLAVCVWYEHLRAAGVSTARRAEIGMWRGELRVRHESINGWDLPSPVTLLYASDLHLNWPWSRGIARQLASIARRHRPTAILLGGDMLDRRRGLRHLPRVVRVLARIAPVYAMDGNHDVRVGTLAVRAAVEEGGGIWISEPIELGGFQMIAETTTVGDASRKRLMCAHNPAVFPAAARAGIDLVLAGHLHGGQCVLLQRGEKLYPGCLFLRWTGPRFVRDRTTMLVSNGAGDLLPLRWNCPREVILCQLS